MNWKNILEADFTLSAQQMAHFEALDGLYREWNAQINVISRKDIDALYEHHVLHSLAIARYLQTVPGLWEVGAVCCFYGAGPWDRGRISRDSAGHSVSIGALYALRFRWQENHCGSSG